ncbi:PrgI family protein [Candidatus Woesebacteria bacterium]|nr:PrgI family protein [Candidatus Woesebacteria bacterium]
MNDFEQQHAIPQQISAYQFRLVGDMTLKQFFQLAAGALVSLMIYATNLPPIVKWPLIIISFLTGVGMAFFPLEGRPLEKWIFLFAKSIYSPTLFIWNRSKVVKTYFKPEDPSAMQDYVSLPQTQDQQIQEQAQMAPPGKIEEVKKSLKNLEQQEQEFLSKVSSNFEFPAPDISEVSDKDRKVVHPSGTKDVEIPDTPDVEIEKPEEEKEEVLQAQSEEEISSEVTPKEEERIVNAKDAEFTPEASPPTPPVTPNIVVGQVLENDGKIIEAAILEIKDDLGRPTRAVKTNKLGHFQIVTPLVDGKYKIITEKQGYEFDIVEFEAKGEIIPPIMIKGKKTEESQNDQTDSSE